MNTDFEFNIYKLGGNEGKGSIRGYESFIKNRN